MNTSTENMSQVPIHVVKTHHRNEHWHQSPSEMHFKNLKWEEDKDRLVSSLVSFGMCHDTFGILLTEFQRWRVAFAFQTSKSEKKRTRRNVKRARWITWNYFWSDEEKSELQSKTNAEGREWSKHVVSSEPFDEIIKHACNSCHRNVLNMISGSWR